MAADNTDRDSITVALDYASQHWEVDQDGARRTYDEIGTEWWL